MRGTPDDPHQPSTEPAPADLPQPSRRRFLGGVAVLGAGATLASYGQTTAAADTDANAPRPLPPAELDKALREQVKTVVVIYAENRSFNNLFADFPGTQQPAATLKPEQYQQRDRDGSLLTSLPPAWGGVLQVGPQNVDGVTYARAQGPEPGRPAPGPGDPRSLACVLSEPDADQWRPQ
jgi:phospholipase C